ncbi:prepilin-type N-terminal cleavage/methylation domain-containing protein [Planctomycetota bacterium]
MRSRLFSQTCSCVLSPGFTMVECVISIVVVGVLLVAVLQTVGAAKLSQLSLVQTIQGQTLAQSLMAEILPLDYQEAGGSSVMGRDVDESEGVRTDYDDVDDYADWNAAPPVYEDGTVMSDLTGWQREVIVEWVDPENPANVSGTESGTKRITVTVRYQGRLVHSLTALRSAYELEG